MSGGFELRFGLLPALGYCFLVLEESEGHSNTKLEEEIGPILSVEGFIQAWVSDVEYDFWQNATDPLEYECVGRPLSGLPMKSNGCLPPWIKWKLIPQGILAVTCSGKDILRRLEALCG